ncbi:MAG: hypothetical protein ACTSUZ_08160 [Candidatus Thorarchaeota archaeon]
MSISMIIEKIRNENPQVSDKITKVETRIKEIKEEIDAIPQLIGWDLLLFRLKQLLILDVGITSDKLQTFDTFWESTTTKVSHGYNLVYDPPRVYNLLLRYPESFQKLLQSYRELKEAQTPSLRTEYLDAFFHLRVQYRPNLTPGELSILCSIIEDQSRSLSILMKKYGKTKSYFSKIITTLRNKNAFYEAIRFAYSVLSLNVVIVLVEMDNLDADIPIQFSSGNPWIHSLYDCKFGNRFILANLILPVSWRSNDELRMWKEEMLNNNRVTDVHIFERNEQLNWMNFNYSAFSGNGWNTTPTTIGTLIRQMYRKDYSEYDRSQIPELSNFQISCDDIQMIATLHQQGPISVRQLRSKLSKDYNIVRARYEDLIRRRIIWHRIYPSPLFAPESITIVAKLDDHEHYQICHALTCLPEVYVQRTKCLHSIITMRLPEGSLDYVVATLNEFLRGKERWLLQYTGQQFTNWQFPLDRWVESHRVWTIHDSDFGG